jgi:hypothetical protein
MIDNLPPFTSEEIDADVILAGMVADRLPLTRENYIIRNWGEIPEDWSAELEAELPERLQDWSLFGL